MVRVFKRVRRHKRTGRQLHVVSEQHHILWLQVQQQSGRTLGRTTTLVDNNGVHLEWLFHVLLPLPEQS